MQINPGQAAWKDSDQQVIPQFYKDSKYMPFQSEQEGRPVFKPMDMVKIMQAGEVDNLKIEVDETHKQRWPQQWAAYQSGQEQMIAGIPLIELFPANPEVIAQLKTVNVHTIEGLLAVADSAQHAVPFLTEWKNRAKAYIERTSKASRIHDMEQRFAAKEQAMAERMAALEAKLLEASEPKSKKAA